MELLGIIGTICILIAFLQKGELKIRMFDLLGAFLFVVYGISIASFSTVLLNVALIIIQIIFIIKLLKEESNNGKDSNKKAYQEESRTC